MPLFPSSLSVKDLEFLCGTVSHVKIQVQMRFKSLVGSDISSFIGFSSEQFAELASKLKNSVYPTSLIEKSTQMNEQCISLEVPGTNLNVKIWKKQQINMEGDLKQVICALLYVKKAIKEAVLRSTKSFSQLTVSFDTEELYNMSANVPMNIASSWGALEPSMLLRTMRLLDQKYGAVYLFKENSHPNVSHSSYTVNYRHIKGHEMKHPQIEFTTDSFSIMGGFQLEWLLNLRKHFLECLNEVKQ